MFRRFFLSLLVWFSLTTVSVFGNTWEHLPLNNNYFDPNNYWLSGEYYDWEFSCIHPFRIKENAVYSLSSKKYTEYFFAGVNIIFYDGEGNEILENPPVRLRRYNNYGVMEISFTSPLGARFLRLDFTIEIESQPPIYPGELFKEFVIYEGANAYYFQEYGGADYLHEVVYEGMQGYYRTNVDDPIGLSEIKSALKARDSISGDVTGRITIVEDNYSPNRDRLGTYSVTFGATDLAGNLSTFRIYIEIYDAAPPTITGSDYLIASPSELISAEEIKALLAVADNYDPDVGLEVVADDYTPNHDRLGIYGIVFRARDSSGNESNFTVTVEVKDTEAPTISGPAKIRKSYQETLLLSDILKNYSALDNIDGDVSESIEIASENYEENMYKTGTWSVRLRAKDRSGNVGYLDVQVEVYDGRGPVFFIEKNKLELEMLEEGPDLEIVVYGLQKNGNLPGDQVLSIVSDGYSANKNSPGNHRVVLAGEDCLFDLHLIIKEKIETDSGGFFRVIWEKIGAFFKRIID